MIPIDAIGGILVGQAIALPIMFKLCFQDKWGSAIMRTIHCISATIGAVLLYNYIR